LRGAFEVGGWLDFVACHDLDDTVIETNPAHAVPSRMALRLAPVVAFASLACSPASSVPEPAEAAPTLSPAPVESPAAAPSPSATEVAEPTPVPTVLEPAAASGFELAVADLVAGQTPSAESADRAWVHYRGEEFAAAQREFALASLHDRQGWKHPFNLACASARAKDEAMVQVGLVEALARDPAKVAKKAGTDKDLEAYRSSSWFEAALATAVSKEMAMAERASGPMVSRPPPPGGLPIPAGTAKALAKRELGVTRERIEAVDGVAPRLRASLTFDDASGTQIAFVVYDFTLSARCKAEAEGDRAALADCLADLQPDAPDRSEVGNQTMCVEQYLVRIELGAELVVGDAIELEVSCDPNEVRRLDLADVDGDGQLEVVLDTIGMAKTLDVAGEDVGAFNRARHFAILNQAGQIQYQLELDGMAELPITTITRVFLLPDPSGHPKLIEQSVSGIEMSDAACAPASVDADFWPSCLDEDWSKVEEVVLVYDAKSDTWLRP
jgi:hypothetical protein